MQAWIAGFVDAGAVLLDAPDRKAAVTGPVDLLSDDVPAGALEHCCFEDFIFARGTPREKTVSPLLTGVLKVARATESAKKGPESASNWGDFIECDFRLDGLLLVVTPVAKEMDDAESALEGEASTEIGDGTMDPPGTQRAKLKQKATSAKLKANDLKVRAAKKILSDSFEHGDGQLTLHASKHHDVTVLEDECAFAVVGGGSGSTLLRVVAPSRSKAAAWIVALSASIESSRDSQGADGAAKAGAFRNPVDVQEVLADPSTTTIPKLTRGTGSTLSLGVELWDTNLVQSTATLAPRHETKTLLDGAVHAVLYVPEEPGAESGSVSPRKYHGVPHHPGWVAVGRTEEATRREALPGGNMWTMMGVLLTVGAEHEKVRLAIVGAAGGVEGGGTVDLDLSTLAQGGRVSEEVVTAWQEYRGEKGADRELQDISMDAMKEATERVEMVRSAKGKIDTEIAPLLATRDCYDEYCAAHFGDEAAAVIAEVARLKALVDAEVEAWSRLEKALTSFKSKEEEFLKAQDEAERALRQKHEQQRRQMHVAVTAFREEQEDSSEDKWACCLGAGRVQAQQHLWMAMRSEQPSASGDQPEISDWDRVMLQHHAAAQLEHVKNGMITAKRSGVDYREYLKNEMPGDFENEFVTGERKNERYHAMWKALSSESEIVRMYTDAETNVVLDVDGVAAQTAVVGVLATESLAIPRTTLEVAGVWVNSLVQRRRDRLKVLLHTPAVALGDQLWQLEGHETSQDVGGTDWRPQLTLEVAKGPTGFGMIINSDCTVAKVSGAAEEAGVQVGSKIHAVNAVVVSAKSDIVAQLQSLAASDDSERAYFTLEAPPKEGVVPADMYYDALTTLRCELRQWMELIPWYKSCSQCYSFLNSTDGASGAPFIKPSALKKDARFAFVATNLCVQQWQLRPVPAGSIGDDAQRNGQALVGAMDQPVDTSLAVVTSGCAAAHYLGTKGSGLRRMELEARSGGSGGTKELVEKDAAIARRRDVALGQAVAIASTAFFTLLESVVSGSDTTTSRNGDSDTNDAAKALLAKGEFLLVFESLLSTAGGEMAMLEDLDACVSQLNNCVTFVCKPKLAGSEGHGGSVNSVVGVHCVTSSELQIEIELTSACFSLLLEPEPAVPARGASYKSVFEVDSDDDDAAPALSVSESAAAGSDGVDHPGVRVNLTALLFTRGVNEQQTKAQQEAKVRKEVRRDVAVQDEINTDALVQLQKFVGRHVDIEAGLADGGREREKAQKLEQLIQEVVRCVESKVGPDDKKGAEVLQRVSALTRVLGGARVTHCKSGKDRTSMSVTLEEMSLLSATLARLQLQHRDGGSEEGAAQSRGEDRPISLPKAAAAVGFAVLVPGALPIAAAAAVASHYHSVDGVAHSTTQAAWCQTLRSYGVRRENVRLNTGKDTFAFNAIQVKFLPEEYRPPPGAAGKGTS